MKIDIKKLKTQAEQLILQYNLTVPVQVFQLADLMGISWRPCNTLTLKKELVKSQPSVANKIRAWDSVLGFYDNKRNCVMLNDSNQSITRKRFTMAHEIAHITLHNSSLDPFQTIHFRDDISKPRDKKEAEANYFAAYLLMPDSAIREKLDIVKNDQWKTPEVIDLLSKFFVVSPEAVAIRVNTYINQHFV